MTEPKTAKDALEKQLEELKGMKSIHPVVDGAKNSLIRFGEILLSGMERAQPEQAPSPDKLNAVYSERMMVVRMLAVMSGCKYGIGKDDNTEWEDAWRNVVYIDLPQGQVSWHIAAADMHLFADFPPYEGKWDGKFSGRDPEFAKSVSLTPASDIPGLREWTPIKGHNLKEREYAVLWCKFKNTIWHPVVGYLRYSGGDKRKPFFVTPVPDHYGEREAITHYVPLSASPEARQVAAGQSENVEFIKCLELLGFKHEMDNGDHVVTGNGFEKRHTSLRGILLRLKNALYFRVPEAAGQVGGVRVGDDYALVQVESTPDMAIDGVMPAIAYKSVYVGSKAEPTAVDIDAFKRELDQEFMARWGEEKDAGAKYSIYSGCSTALIGKILEHLASIGRLSWVTKSGERE